MTKSISFQEKVDASMRWCVIGDAMGLPVEKKNKEDRKVLKWQKVSGGPFYAIIDEQSVLLKKGQKFEATEEEVPKAFRDTIICLSKVVEAPESQSAHDDAPYTVVETEGGWNVVDEENELLNEQPLTKQEAEALAEELAK